MTIEDKDAAATSMYKGTKYYFCSSACKKDFEKAKKLEANCRDPEARIILLHVSYPETENSVA